MEFPLLNKFEKEQKVIELHKQGKTLKEIAVILHMSFRDISRIIKKYERKITLQAKKGENNHSSQIKKISKSSQAFKLFSDGKRPTEVACELDIPFEKTKKFWSQFLNLERMEECYEFYQDYRYDIPTLLSISNFIKRNNVDGKDIANVLRAANDSINLNQTLSNLKVEIEKLKQTKNNYSLNQNHMRNYQLPPLGPLPGYYNW